MKNSILVLVALLLISFRAKAQEISGIETARTINVANYGVSDLDVFFGNNQQLIAYSNNSGRNEGDTLVIYDYKNDNVLSKIKGSNWKFDIQFINENQLLYFNNNIIYKVENFTNPTVTELFNNGMIESFIVSPDKSKVLVNTGTVVKLFSYDGTGLLTLLKTFSVTGFELAISNDNKYIAVSGGYNNDYINLINTDDSSITKISTSVHNGTYSPAFFNQDNKLKLAVGGGYTGGSIEIIDVLTKTLEQKLPEFTSYNFSISVDPTQKYMVCAGFEGTINMVSIKSNSFSGVFSQNSGILIKKIIFSQDGRYIISGHEAGSSSSAKLVVHKVNYRGSKTMAVTAGSLATLLTTAELDTISYFTLTGTIDARDFKTMRDNMPLLAVLDLSGASIAAYTGIEGPSLWENNIYPANTIPGCAFSNSNLVGKKTLKQIILPSSTTAIGRYSFCNCSGLTSVDIPLGYTSIGEQAFAGCSGLIGALMIPASVNTIGNHAFTGCIGVNFFSIPSSVISIVSPAFLNDPGLINVDKSNTNYSSIDGVLFDKNIKTLLQCPISKKGGFNIPSSVTSIGVQAFYNCSEISSFNLPIGLVSINNYAFLSCKSLTSLTLPEGLVSIGINAFWACSKLNSIIIPSTVKTISSGVFQYCSSVTSITVNIPNPIDLTSSNNVFNGINISTCKLYVPFGSKSLYASANQWKDFANIVEMPSVNLSSNSVKIGASANSQSTIDLVCNVPWTASSDQTWLTVSPTSGSANEIITFTAQANTTPLSRIAKVTFSAPGIDPQTVTVTQSFVIQPLVGSFTINPVGGDFVSFKDATTALNINGVGTGGVKFLVAAGTTYNESGLIVRTNTSGESNPVAFQKDGAGANPIIYGKKVTGNDTTSVIFLIAGSDYITFDGVDITSNPAAINDSVKIMGGYVITNPNSITNGSNHITIKNCKIDIDRRSTQDRQNGISLNQSALSASGTNSNILIDHVQFVKGRTSFRSNATTIPDENIEIRNCTFGEGGTTIEPIDYEGLISVNNCKNFSFHDNEIQNIVAPDFYAIDTRNLTGDNHIYNNKIHNLKSTSTIEDSDLFGIYSSSIDANAIVNVYNNLIYDLEGAKSSSTIAPNTYWNLQIIDLTGNAKYKIFNNTVIGNSKNQHENTMLCWANLYSEIRNNIFADFSVPGANSIRSIVLVEALFENNLIWMDDSLQNNFVFNNLYKFREWQKGTRTPSSGNHLTNFFANPNFTDPANLDFTIKSPSPVSNNGKPIGFITSDLNGTTRNASTPDIGAIEGDFGPAIDLLPPVISFQPITNNSLAIVKFTAEITDNTKVANAKLWYRVKNSSTAFNSVQGNQYGNLWEFIFPTLVTGDYEYFVCAKDGSGNIASNGYMVSGLDANSTGLLANNPPVRPDFVNSFSYKMQLPEILNYTIGVGGNFESLTKPGGLFDLLNSSFIDRNIQVTIISDLDETGEIPLQQLRKTGNGNYSITIKPNSATLKTVTNMTASNINFLGADIIVIDGSFNGDNLNHLKFVCNGANPLRFFNIDAFGNHDITMKYCDFSSTSFACIYAYGSSRSSFTIDHVNAIKGYSGISLTNIGNSSITNCIIGNSDPNNSMTNYGIYLSGCSNIAVENNTILNVVNTVNLSAQGIWLSNVIGGNITRNKIINVTNKSISGSQVSNGLYGSGCRNITVSNNIISGINGNGHPYSSYLYGIKGIVLTASNSLKLYYNTIQFQEW